MEVLIVPFDSSLSAACWWLLEVWFTAPTVTAIYQIMPASRSLAVWTPSLLRHTRPCWEGLHGFGSLNQPQKLSWMTLFASASSAADVTVAGLAVSGWHWAEVSPLHLCLPTVWCFRALSVCFGKQPQSCVTSQSTLTPSVREFSYV